MELADLICGAPPEVVERHYGGLTRTWQAVDRMVGKLMEARDHDTLVAVISDHGGTPGRWPQVSMARVLEEAGWLVYSDPDRRHVDWSRTRAHPVGLVNVYINLKGREPDGIVSLTTGRSASSSTCCTSIASRQPANIPSAWCSAARTPRC
jgi:predicted AlkP superfamily phosphohydrolase/phosphomutase